MFLGFLGKKLHTHNLACTGRLVLACASCYLETPTFICFFFASSFHMLFCLVSFLCFYASKVSVLHVCLFICYHMFRLGFLSSNAMPFTCPCINAIGAVLLKGK